MLSPYLRLAKLELDIAPVSLRGFAFSRRVVDLEKYEDGGNHCFWAWGIALLRREVRCAGPPLWRGFSLSGVDSERVLGFGARSGLRRASGFTSRQEGFAMQLRGRLPDSRSVLITGDFANRRCPHTTFVSREENRKVGNFFQDLFAVRTRFAFVSLRQACYRLFRALQSPVDSPWDQRGKSRSRNRMLRFEIRVDSRRISPRSSDIVDIP